MNRRIDRREFLNKTVKGAAGLAAATCVGKSVFAFPSISNNKIAKKMFVLGIDGMDPGLLKRFVKKGEMPTFKRFIEANYFGSLRTTLPPQSPVAWSSFITGSNPGRHGIFDFIHRDPTTFIPYLSTSRSYDPQKTLNLGKWSIPLDAGKVELLRGGPTFWTSLEENGIPVTLYKIPANFPVQISRARALSGMSTKIGIP